LSTRTSDLQSVYHALDEADISRRHWRTVLIAGMGFFTDAYDLFIIGTVTAILTPLWHLTTQDLMWLNSTSLLASMLGAILFGRIMDLLGRKSIYGIEVILLTLGAVFSAFSHTVWQLVLFRALVGFGVGGDYAGSAIIASEYANRSNRGQMIGTVFSMQGLGLLAGPAIASLMLASGMPHDLAWRLMLALGAVPAASVIYLRRTIKETPRYALGVRGEASSAAQLLGDAASRPAGGRFATRQRKAHLWDPPFRRRLLGTAGAWLLMDVAFYGTGVSSQIILHALMPGASLLSSTLTVAAIFLVAAFPGYWFAVRRVDKTGRKRIQWRGFLIMGIAYGLIALIPAVRDLPSLFLAVYAISYFFIEFGPNVTTFIFPAEVFPIEVRGLGDGISAGSGKLGAFLGAFLMPLMVLHLQLAGTMAVLAVVSLLGALLTIYALPETKGLPLEIAAAEDRI
jgi:MFS family permease